VKLDGDTAVIDLSSEFKKLGNLGSQGESDAQSALIKCLAKSPEVQKMRVLVEGKLYEGEHSGEWDAIPVRDKVAGGA
jgi:spore germination protein GerM